MLVYDSRNVLEVSSSTILKQFLGSFRAGALVECWYLNISALLAHVSRIFGAFSNKKFKRNLGRGRFSRTGGDDHHFFSKFP